MDMPAVAITDSSNLFGAMEFSLEASKAGVQPIIGAQILVGSDEHQLVLLVQSEEGYQNLCHLISDSYIHSDGVAKPCISWAHLKEFSGGLICLSGSVKGPIGQALLAKQYDLATEIARDLKEIFGDRFYIELQRHDDANENQIENSLIDIAYAENIPLVATNECYFPSADFYRAHDALMCIAEGRYISEDDRRKVTPHHYLKSPEEMVELFADIPEAIHNTVAIAKRCHFFLTVVKPLLPPFVSENGLPEPEELRRQAVEGLQWRLENFVFTADDIDRDKIQKPILTACCLNSILSTKWGSPDIF
jgi:DNA polymerase-3 subunit alpha